MTSKFSREFYKCLREDMTVGGAVGSSEGGFNPDANINSTDSYAPGDARAVMSIFTGASGVQTRDGMTKSKKKTKGENK
jgi:hypothetical protein